MADFQHRGHDGDDVARLVRDVPAHGSDDRRAAVLANRDAALAEVQAWLDGELAGLAQARAEFVSAAAADLHKALAGHPLPDEAVPDPTVRERLATAGITTAADLPASGRLEGTSVGDVPPAVADALRVWRIALEHQTRAELLEDRVDDATTTLGALEDELRNEAEHRVADIEAAATEALLLAELDDPEPDHDPSDEGGAADNRVLGGEVIELPRRPDED